MASKLIGCGLVLLAQAAPVDAQSGPWRLSLQAGVNYSNNVRFQTSGSQREPRGLVGVVGAGLAHTFVGADSSLNVGGHAGALFFKNLSELNRVTSAANVGYTRPLSDRTSLNVSDQYASNYNTLLDDLANEGVFLPLAGTRRNHAALDLDHDISERSTMGISVKHDLFFFRGDPDFEPDLIDGWRLGTGLHFGRRFSATQSGTLGFGYSRNGRSANASDGYSTGVGWSQALGPRLRVSTDIGASMGRSATQSATRATGSASVVWQLWQGSLRGSFYRSMGLGLGLGRVTVREGFALGFNQTLWRRLNFSISGRQVSHADPFDTLFEYDAQSFTVHLSMKVIGSMGISTAYNYVNRREGRDVSGFKGGLQVSYHKDF